MVTPPKSDSSSLLQPVNSSDSSLDSTEPQRTAYLALQSRLRFPFLFLICAIEFGRCYCVDLPAAHQKAMISVLSLSSPRHSNTR